MRNIEAAILGGLAVSLAVAYGCGHSSGGGGSSFPPSVAVVTSASTSGSTVAAVGSIAIPGSKLEYLEFAGVNSLSETGIVSFLSQTVGAATVTSGAPANLLPLRTGFYVTAIPEGNNTVLQFSSDAAGVRPLSTYIEVAVSNDMAEEYIALVQVAMATESLTVQTPGLAAAWNLILHAESPTGGVMELNVTGDANANFAVSWKLDSPQRPIDGWATPAAFGLAGSNGAIEYIGGTVHFPIDEPTFKFFVNQAYGYGAPQRFNDFPLIPHAWLHLTVTADPTGRIVNVRFDAIVTSGARLFVAQAPASTDAGGRFFDDTCARMEEMSTEQAAQPGSSKPWGTSFYYTDPTTGVVDVVVNGVQGKFDIAYTIQTPTFVVSP
jgi:hypothetical protein